MLIINTNSFMVALEGTINGKSTHVHLSMGKNRVADNFVPDPLAVARYGNKMVIDTSFVDSAPAPEPIPVSVQVPAEKHDIIVISKEQREALNKPTVASNFKVSASK